MHLKQNNSTTMTLSIKTGKRAPETRSSKIKKSKSPDLVQSRKDRHLPGLKGLKGNTQRKGDCIHQPR